MAYQPFDCREALVNACALLKRWQRRQVRLGASMLDSDRSLFNETGLLCSAIDKVLQPGARDDMDEHT